MAATKFNFQLIVRDPQIQGGEPIIRGTRVPVRSIVLSLQDDYPENLRAVAAAYSVSPAEAEAALAYYRTHQDEIDRLIEQHERAARER